MPRTIVISAIALSLCLLQSIDGAPPNIQAARAAAAPIQQAPSIDAPKLSPEMRKRIDDIEQQIFEGWYTAEVHVIYHHDKATKWDSWDLYLKIAGAIVAIFGYCVSGLVPEGYRFWKWAVGVLGFVCLAFGLGVSYVPVTQWVDKNSELADKWRELAHEWHSLDRTRADVPPAELIKRVEHLEEKQIGIEEFSGKSYDKDALAAAQQQEDSVLGIESGADRDSG